MVCRGISRESLEFSQCTHEKLFQRVVGLDSNETSELFNAPTETQITMAKNCEEGGQKPSHDQKKLQERRKSGNLRHQSSSERASTFWATIG